MRRFLLAMIIVVGFAGPAASGELRPFNAGSLAAIQEAYAGRPFILAFWSLTCTHCAKELQIFGKWVRADRDLPLVIVSADTPADEVAVRDALRRYGLGKVDIWLFADSVPERLRYAVDPGWYGELPRTYFYDAAHRREAHSGVLDERRFKDWLKRNRKAS